MAVDADDVQILLWKILKILSETCVTLSTQYPFSSCSLLCLFLLYVFFPLVFWVLVYSFPLVVCTWIILSVSFSLRNEKKYENEEERDNDGKSSHSRKNKLAKDDFLVDKNKKSFTRVHSVRRRRAKDLWREDNNNNMQQHKVEDKNAVSSTDFNYDMVDKNALTEESPKEIREVEVDYSLVAKSTSPKDSCQSSKHEVFDEENTRDDRGNCKDKEENFEDDQKNHVMDVGISEFERNKRLEILIARRRSRKLLSLQVRRTLMNIDRNDQITQIPSLIIPKHNNPNNCPFSPVPGSAPSVLVPMRNPFDLPYDPQEEKPDLTGDSFQQEFMSTNNNRDIVLCRHESFSFLTGEEKEKKASSHGYHQFSKTGNKFGTKFFPTVERDSYGLSESKPTVNNSDEQIEDIDNPNDQIEDIDNPDDHIKEMIEVSHENAIHNHNEEDINDEVQSDQTRPIPEEADISSTSSSSSSSSSSEEDEPIFKIDKEAILKSLSSMARRNVVTEIDNNDQTEEYLNHANSSLENIRLNEHCNYYANKNIRRHNTSYSIASDMQVEVSEMSSPPVTIDENFSYHDDSTSIYDGDMDKKFSWDNVDLWAGSSHISEVDENESRSTEVNEVSEQDLIKLGFSRIDKQCDLSCSELMTSNAELDDSGEAHDTNLNEKINDETFQTSVSLEEESLDNLNGSNSDNNGQIKEPTTFLSENGEQSLGQVDQSTAEHEEIVQTSNVVDQSTAEASISITQTTSDSNDPQEPPVEQLYVVQNSSLSPKSVLLPALSLDQGFSTSFDHDTEEEDQHFSTQTGQVSSPGLAEHSTALPYSDGDGEVLIQESSEASHSQTSTIEAEDIESVERQKVDENGTKSEEVASGSSQIEDSTHEAPKMEETSSRSLNDDNDEVSSKSFEATNQAVSSENTNHIDNSNSSLSIKEDS